MAEIGCRVKPISVLNRHASKIHAYQCIKTEVKLLCAPSTGAAQYLEDGLGTGFYRRDRHTFVGGVDRL